MILFHRKTYFDQVRASPFGGAMAQTQVDGQEAVLSAWESMDAGVADDLRWLAYMLATDFHETARTMKPIEEYGKGKGKAYGVRDPQTKQIYYGRGLVQLTWRENYARADAKLGLDQATGMEWHAKRALDPYLAVLVMFRGMMEGWFTTRKLSDFFNEIENDPVGARIIINNDVKKNGRMIAGYHVAFLDALQQAEKALSLITQPIEPPEPIEPLPIVIVSVQAPPGIELQVVVNGEIMRV